MILSCFTRKECRWRRQTLCHWSFPVDLTCLFGFSWGYWRLATREQSYLQPQWTACLQGQRSILPCCLDMNSPTCYSCHAVDESNKTHLHVNCWTSNIQNIIRNQHFFTEIFMFMFPKNIICTKKTNIWSRHCHSEISGHGFRFGRRSFPMPGLLGLQRTMGDPQALRVGCLVDNL